MDVEYSSLSSSITFNVCYKYCQTCPIYYSVNPTNNICTSCIPGETYFVDNADAGANKCYSLEEINTHFSNYYLSGPPG